MIVRITASLVISTITVSLAAEPRPATNLAPALERALANQPAASQRVWIFFTDKHVDGAGTLPSAIAARRSTLPDRTLHRRELRGDRSDALAVADLDVPAAYTDAVRATGATLRHTSRWLNAQSADVTPDQLRTIAALPFVRLIQPVAHAAPRPPMPATPIADQPAPRGILGPAFYGPAYNQLNQIGVVAAHNAGYTGSGILIGILDSGFRLTHTAFNQTVNAHPVQVVDQYDFVNNDSNPGPQPGDPPEQHRHGTYILGTIGAYKPGVLVGAAYDASFVLAKTEDVSQEVPVEEDNYVAGLEWIEAHGADLATSSLGYIDWYTQADLDGQTAVTTVAVNTATALGLVCCTAAGNEGNDASPATSHLIAPADAMSVLTCGAVDLNGVITYFSSDGPTADGRVKPELLARGLDTATVAAEDNSAIIAVSGTSLSTPLLAGGTALLIQAHPNWSAAKIRRVLLHTADRFTNTGLPDPLFVRGYGIVNIDAAINFVEGDINQDGVANGDDVAAFSLSLAQANPDLTERILSDLNVDGQVSAADVPIFISDLLAN